MKIREMLDSLDEISRRDFLKGAGATAGLAATDAISAPFKHSTPVDPMTNKSIGKFTTIKSDNNQAFISILNSGPGSVSINVPEYIDTQIKTRSVFPLQAQGRIKFGNGPVLPITLGQFKIGKFAIIDTAGIRQKILTHTGEMKIEIPLSRSGAVVYKFTIEPDATSQELAKNNKDLDEASDDAVARILELSKNK